MFKKFLKSTQELKKQKKEKTGAIGLGRTTREHIEKWNQMKALRSRQEKTSEMLGPFEF